MMSKAIILAVDDDRTVLNSVERDLRQKYGREFRIAKAESGLTALEFLNEIKKRNETVALFVVDQRMPVMDGIQFLEQAMRIFPDARKVLLTAYADTEAAINAINRVNLDYFLLKPWDPPTEHLYPVLDSLIEDWRYKVLMPFEGIRVIGNMWSPICHAIKDFLARNSIPYLWMDIERENEAVIMLDTVGLDRLKIPVLIFPDGSIMEQPSLAELALKSGLKTQAEKPFYDVVIVGAGPAGLSAAVYASADGLKVLVVERGAPGGQAGNSPKIENYMGFPSGISGSELTRRAVTQARRFGAEILTTQDITGVELQGNTKVVNFADGTQISSKILLIATGAWFRTLDLPGIERWHGAGVYYGAAHTEAIHYRDQPVIVVGGANSAAQAAVFLANYASKVTILIRSGQPTWSHYLDVAINSIENIEIMFNSNLAEIHSDQTEKTIEEVVIQEKLTAESVIEDEMVTHGVTGEKLEAGSRLKEPVAHPKHVIKANAIFVFIGQKPQSDFVSNLVALSEKGFILTGLDLIRKGVNTAHWKLARDPLMLETSVSGIFAAGDVRNGAKHGVAAATGDGGSVVSMFWQYLSTI
jgi:thioredoxin reductase (NADPH)